MGGVFFAAQFHRNHDVFQGGQGGNELEVLENKADFLIADARRPAVLVQHAEVNAVQAHAARGRVFQSGAETEEGGLAAAGRPDDGAGGAGGDGEGDILDDRQRAGGAGVGFGQLLRVQDDLARGGWRVGRKIHASVLHERGDWSNLKPAKFESPVA